MYLISLNRLIIIALSILFSMLPSEKNEMYSKNTLRAFSCVIDYYDGMEGIALATSNFKEIEKVLGPGIRSKKKYPSFTVENIFPVTKHILSYPKLGISFTTHAQGRMNFTRIATSLIVDASSTCKSKNGIGIGSTYQELIERFGNSRYTQISSPEGDYSKVLFSFPEYGGIFVHFRCNGKKHIDDFRVEEILIRRSFP